MRTNDNGNITRRTALAGFAASALCALGIRSRADQTKPAKVVTWDPKMEVGVDFELILPQDFRYHRPYVSVWIEDKQGKSIRTLSLWVSTSRRGPRWIPDLRRWYRGLQASMAAGGPDLVATISSATRMPGKYSVAWDGKDDKGVLVPQGSYTFFLETAREHGPYTLMQQELVVGNKPFKKEVAGNSEVKGATLEYRKRK